ncbi:SMR family transporter [Bacillus tianshenii]|nr:SMR family transporter [Bacillus tianshenii]
MRKVYILLGLSISFEVIGASFMKKTEGFQQLEASLIVIISYGLALVLYILITKEHELGIINALWSGGGTAIVTVIGILLFNEALTATKLLGVGLVLSGIFGLNGKG